VTIFRCHYVNLTVIKFKTLTDTVSNENLKKRPKRPKDSGITLKHNGQKVTLNYFKI